MSSLDRSALAWATLLLLGCAGDPGAPPTEGVVTRETFITTYVDLRVAALNQDLSVLPPEEVERVLAENQVTEQEMEAFVDTFGRDVTFMKGIWDEVEVRLDRVRDAREDEGR